MNFPGSAKAQKAMLANLSPRFHRLDRLERYVDGTQYDVRRPFWDESEDAPPVFERAPCIVYPIVDSAIRSNVNLCLGEGRWPEITALCNEDDSAFDPQFGLDEADSEVVDSFIKAIVEQARVKAVSRECLEAAQGQKTAVAIVGVRNGKLVVDTTKAKWCTREIDEQTGAVTSLEIRYPYIEEFYDKQARCWDCRCMVYRRVIDDTTDTTFLPAEAQEDGTEPDWKVNPKKTVKHGLGFCPVIWYRFMSKCSSVADVDGKAIHENLTDEIDALNFALSLRHRGATYASDPQFAEIGVDKDYNPAPIGRTADVVIVGDVDPETGLPIGSSWRAKSKMGTSPARMRGPGIVWKYENKDSDVKVLTLPGDALVPADSNCRDLRAKIAESLSVVFQDFENAQKSVDVSGRALRENHRKQTDNCDLIRDDFGHNFLLPLIDMLLRVAMVKADGLYLAGVKKAVPILKRFLASVEGSVEQWFSPRLHVSWGDYFKLTGQDKLADINAVVAARNAKFITRQTCVEEMREYFDIGSPHEYLEALEKEDEESAKKALENATAMAAIQKPAGSPGQPQQQQGKPPFGGKPQPQANA